MLRILARRLTPANVSADCAKCGMTADIPRGRTFGSNARICRDTCSAPGLKRLNFLYRDAEVIMVVGIAAIQADKKGSPQY